MSLRRYAKLRKRREFRKFSYNLKGCVIASWGKVTHGSKMHSISCSFYLFVLPSISSRALSSLALASYSSSMNSCCRFLPERKKSHRQSFATQRKGQIWQCFCHCLSLRSLLLEQTALQVTFSATVPFIQNSLISLCWLQKLTPNLPVCSWKAASQTCLEGRNRAMTHPE